MAISSAPRAGRSPAGGRRPVEEPLAGGLKGPGAHVSGVAVQLVQEVPDEPVVVAFDRLGQPAGDRFDAVEEGSHQMTQWPGLAREGV